MKTFEMSDLGSMKYFLGLEVWKLESSIFVSQSKYTENLHSHDNSGKADALRYMKFFRGLLYLSRTHLDIMHVESMVSQFMESPCKHHFGDIKGILR